MHLSPEAFIECLDDQGEDLAQRHLRACAACRAELAQLRASMAALLDVDVPEPSPLFWGHLSARVRDAVAAEAPPPRRRSWRDVVTQPAGWGWPVWPAVATAVALVGFLALPQRHVPLAPAPDASVAGAVEMPWTQPSGSADDPSLALVGALAAQVDWDAMTETGMASRGGGADEVVTSLTDDERLALGRLLKEALARSGA